LVEMEQGERIRGGTTWTEDFKCREVKTGFCRNRSMQTGLSGTLVGWKSGQTCPSMGPNGGSVDMDSAHSAGAYTATLNVMVNRAKGGWACNPHSHPTGLIFPSWWNVRKNSAIATLCLLCGLVFIEGKLLNIVLISKLSDVISGWFDSQFESPPHGWAVLIKRLSCAISWWSWGRDRQASTLAHCSPPGRLSGTLHNRNKDGVIYRGPGFLVVIWFGSSPIPSAHLPSASWLCFSIFLCVVGRAYRRERGGRGRSPIIRRRESLAPIFSKSGKNIILWYQIQC
jgi:hypothetical protein